MAVKDKKKAKVVMGSTSVTPHITQEKEKEKEKESSVIVDSSGVSLHRSAHFVEKICLHPKAFTNTSRAR
jgi:hypothetical protein